jgi:hypothetical protein
MRPAIHRTGPESQVDGPFSRVTRVILAQAITVESRPAAWDGDLERLLETGDGDKICPGFDNTALRQRHRASGATLWQR